MKQWKWKTKISNPKNHIKMENKWKLSKINVSTSCPEAYSVYKSSGRLPSRRNSMLKILSLNLETSRANTKRLKHNQSRVMSWGGGGDISHLPMSKIIPVFVLPTSTLIQREASRKPRLLKTTQYWLPSAHTEVREQNGKYQIRTWHVHAKLAVGSGK